MRVIGLFVAFCGLLLTSAGLEASDVSAKHGNDVVQIGKSISVGPGESVGDAVCVGCSIHVAGRATGDLVAVGGSVQVDGTVDGDTVAVGGNLRLGPGSLIHGDVTVVGGKLQRDPSSRVDGEISNPSMMVHGGTLALILLVPFLVMLLVGVVLSVLCVAVVGEQRIETIVSALRRHAGLAFLAGLGVLAGFVVLVVVFHWTGPFSPMISLALFVALLVLAVVGYAGVSAWVGHSLAPASGVMGAVIAGAVLVGVLQAIPFLGLFAIILFGFWALGAAALSGLGTRPEWLAERLSNRPVAPRATTAGGR
ncbi:MAG TPA: polymer-forming cytoskeletal protein [Terriglobales bacterium]|nr:polymer-forming cytoskeletal protein [Terriglobales bacterium]